MSKNANTVLNKPQSNNFSFPEISLSALAIATLESQLAITLIGLLTVAWFGASEPLESTLWLISPIIGVVLGVIRYRTYLQLRWAPRLQASTVCISYLGIGASIFVLRFHFPHLLSATLLLAASLIAVIILQMSCKLVDRKQAPRIATKEIRSVIQLALMSVLGLLGICLTLAAFWPNAYELKHAGYAFVFACCGTAITIFSSKFRVSRAQNSIIRVLFVSVAALAVWDLARDFDIHHLGFFLAPANEVQHGRLMLVDTFSQYGVGVIYFLVGLLKFLGFGYGSLMFLTGGLAALTTVLVFTFLVYTTRSTMYSTLGTYASAILGPLASLGSVASYPSTGFLRFGPTWLLILVLTITLKRDFPSRVWIAITSGVLAISLFWSFESAFYSLGTFVVIGVFGPVVIGERALAKRLVRSAIVSVAIIGSVGSLLTVIFSGQSINLVTYLKYLKLYSLDGLGAVPVEPWSPGILMFLLAVASLTALAVVFASKSLDSATIRRDWFPILAVTTYSILAFTYFLGRSHPNNLTHISAPFVVMITMWLSRLGGRKRFGSKLLCMIMSWSSLFGFATIGFVNWPSLNYKLPNSALASLSPETTSSFLNRAVLLTSNPVIDSRSETIESLLRNNLPSATPVLLVVDANLMTETLVRLGRVNLITLSNPEGESLLSSEVHRITSQIATIPCDSYVLLQQSAFRKNDAQEMLLLIMELVKTNFRLSLVAEDSEFGLYVMGCA